MIVQTNTSFKKKGAIMKAIMYFILFYASVFLISMIPEEAMTQQSSNKEEVIQPKTTKNSTSYVEFADSVKQQFTNGYN